MNMKIHSILATIAVSAVLSFAGAFSTAAQETYSPDGTYLFATKDGQDLYLDEYKPAQGSQTTFEGQKKPTVIFVFGGGFVSGTRNAPFYLPWYKMLNDEGYGVISIDYRLSLKGVKTKGTLASAKLFNKAVTIAAEDLFSATDYIIKNAEQLDVDPARLVISGSSAGALTVLQADWMLCNGKATEKLPEGFRYAGVMSFSGAIFSLEGMPKYKTAPAPTAFFHGTADKIVNYNKMRFFNVAFAGSSKLVKIFKKNGYTYNILRYPGHAHEIASAMFQAFPEEIRFLETDVTKGQARNIDAMIEDPAIPKPHGTATRKELYRKN